MNTNAAHSHQPWNKGKIVGQKAPLQVRDIWAIRVRLQLAEKTQDLALFNLAIDSKLRACALTQLRVRDTAHGEHVSSRAVVMQRLERASGSANDGDSQSAGETRGGFAAWG
ncbi:hypothetical protein PseAD21_20510 [Pseudomonas sp. AD21]|jgi:hypothetical protein|nr:hypothetical protein PseAD21_20510 [Pseudomonas sp. AD21]